jgi:hypothetical protein
MTVRRQYLIMDGKRATQRVSIEMDETNHRPPGRITFPDPPKDRQETEAEILSLDPVEYQTADSTTYSLSVSRERFPDFDPTDARGYMYFKAEEH